LEIFANGVVGGLNLLEGMKAIEAGEGREEE